MMKMVSRVLQLNLSDDNVAPRSPFPWFHLDSVHVKGYVYSDGHLLTGASLAALFKNVNSKSSLERILKSINGYFAVIIEHNDDVFAAVDRISSTSLLYRVGRKFEIGDSFSKFVGKHDPLYQVGVLQYLSAGYVFGNRTLLEEVYQIRAGEFVHFNKITEVLVVGEYYRYGEISKEPDSFGDEKYLIDEMHSIHLKVFHRFVNSLGGRQVVVPLSGGFDSRLIAEMLCRFSYENVLCVTWGADSNWQVQIARDVARSLGFQWTRIDASHDDWRRWYNSGAIEREFELCGALASIPYIQDNLLIKVLEERGELQGDAVFVTGNSGDFIQGDHIMLASDPEDRSELLRRMKRKHMRLSPIKELDLAGMSILEDMKFYHEKYGAIEGFDEYWEWRERQSKFVSKCVKPFEANGYEWRMPFWDLELLDFWSSVPRGVKAGRRLFYAYAAQHMSSAPPKANPGIGIFRRYADAIRDVRYGCYSGKGPEFLSFLRTNHFIGGGRVREVTAARPLRLSRMNGLIASDFCGRLERLVAD